MLQTILKTNLRRVISIILVLSMVFCTNSFNNLSLAYADDKETTLTESFDEKTATISDTTDDEEDEVADDTTYSEEPEDDTTSGEEDAAATSDSKGEGESDEDGTADTGSETATDSADATDTTEGANADDATDDTADDIATDSTTEPATDDSSNEADVADDKTATPSDADGEVDNANVDEETVAADVATPSDIAEDMIATYSDINIDENTVVATKSIVEENIEYGEGFISTGKVPPMSVELNDGLFGADPLPQYLDMRDATIPGSSNPVLPAIRNQGSEGLCWAFSTLGMAEIYLRKNGVIDTAADAQASNLSEAAFGYFVLEGLEDVTASGSTNMDYPGYEGNDWTRRTVTNLGGNQEEAGHVASSYMGFNIEDAVTDYDNVGDIFDHGLDGKYAFNENGYEMHTMKFFNKSDTDAIKNAVREYGSVAINFRSHNHTNYGTHTFTWKGKSNEKFFISRPGDPTHAVLIVGWDDTIPKEYFYSESATSPSNPASYDVAPNKATHDGGWLIRNSWGPYFSEGNGGYFWLSYDDPTIDSSLYAMTTVPANTYTYNYHYDTTANGYSMINYGTDANSRKFANIFKVSDNVNQTLDAISIAEWSPGSSCNIDIYTKDTAMSNPTDGTHQGTTQSASFETAGIFTIPLTTPVNLTAGTYFSIVITPTSGDFIVYCDESLTGGGRIFHNEAAAGHSFYSGSISSSYWYDLTNTSGHTTRELRIKALTNPAANTVTFAADGGTGFMTGQTFTPGVAFNLSKNTFKKTGYRFLNWHGSDGNDYTDGQEVTFTSSVTLTAVWEEAHYVLMQDWYDRSVAGTEVDVTSIVIKMYPDASPSDVDSVWAVPGSSGLIASRKGTDVVIYAPDTSFTGKIKIPDDSTLLFSAREWDATVSDYMPDFDHAFKKCESITGLNLLDTSEVTIMNMMFWGMGNANVWDRTDPYNPVLQPEASRKPITIDVSTFDTSNVTDMRNMFDSSAISTMDITTFDMSSVTTIWGMFGECGLLQSVNMSGIDTTNIERASAIFTACESLTSVNLTGCTFENATDMSYMFQYCKALTSLNLSSFRTSNVENMSGMFEGCTALQNITASSRFVTTAVTGSSSDDMFNDCTNLAGPRGTTYAAKLVASPSDAKNRIMAWIDGKNNRDGYFTGAASVNVTFNLAGKGDNFTIPYEKGEAIAEPTTPTYTGWQFNYWYKQGTPDTSYDFSQIIPETSPATITLVAKWSPKTYRVNYDVNEGTISGDTYFTKTYGTAYTTTLKIPTRTGYTFGGWFVDDDTFLNNYHPENDDIYVEGTTSYDIHAKWIGKTYTIRYDANGGTVSPSTFDKVYGTAITTDLAVPTRTGYLFRGWYNDNTTFATLYDKTNDDIYSDIQTTYYVYAKWEPITYTVRFDIGTVPAASPSAITKTYEQARTADLPAPTSIPAGYEFLGWFKENTYAHQWTGKVATDDLTTTDGDTKTVYAKWKRAVVFSVLYNGTNIGATVPTSIEITSPTTITLPNTTATGYTFGGWYREPELTNFVGMNGTAGIAVDSPTTFYAKWTPNQYRINYNTVLTDATIATNSVIKTYGVNVTLHNPSREGYDFDGWFRNYNASTKAYTNPYDGTTDIISTSGGSTTIYAKWTAHQYTITYNTVLSDVTIAQTSITKTYGTNRSLHTPSKTNYTFVGWYRNYDTTTHAYTDAYDGTSDIISTEAGNTTIYAKWQTKVTYNANGHGTAPAAVNVDLWATTTLPTLTNVTGYTFDTTNSWYDGADITTATLIGAAGSDYTVTEPKILYAKWTENEYNITYHNDTLPGVTYTPGYTKPTTRKYSEAKTLPTSENISRVGYNFAGWWTQDGSTSGNWGSQLASIAVNTAEDKDIYAKWNEISYSVNFVLDGGTLSGFSNPTSRPYSQSLTLPDDTQITKTGYDFDGWYEDAEYTSSEVTAVPANISESKTYYAKWTEKNYSLTYHYDDMADVVYRTGYTKPTTRTYTEAKTLPTSDDISRANYVFKGWWSQDGTTSGNWGTQVTSVAANTTTDTEVWARWAASYTVTFDLDQSEKPSTVVATNVPSNQNIESGNKAVAPTINPTAAGYEFLGWYTDTTWGTPFNFGTTVISAPTTVYAKWHAVQTITFTFNMSGHGTQVDTQYVVENTKVVKPADPTAEGYRFVRWYEGTDDTVAFDFNQVIPSTSAPSRTLTAKWEEIEYTITYNRNNGSWVTPYTPTETRLYHVAVTLPTDANITRTGFTFAGWWTQDGSTSGNWGSQLASIAVNTAENKVLYAKWIGEEFDIELHALDGQQPATGAQAIPTSYTAGIGTPLPMDFRKGSVPIVGWYTGYDPATNTYSGTMYTSIGTGVTGDLVLYARYGSPLTITFRSGGGSGSMSNQSVYAGVPTAIKANEFYRNGYYFNGWRLNSGTTYSDRQTITITSNITLTAMWQRESSGGSSGGSSSGGSAGRAVTTQQQGTTQAAERRVSVSMSSIPVNVNTAGSTWTADSAGNWYLNVVNQYGQIVEAKNTFACITTNVTNALGQVTQVQDYYYFGDDGKMYTGWLTDNQNVTYFFKLTGADIGKLAHGWQLVGTDYYYFDTKGALLKNATTPDGYVVGADGKWMK